MRLRDTLLFFISMFAVKMLSNHEELGCRGLCLFFLHRHHRQSHFLSVNGDNLHPHWSFFRIPLLLYFSWIKLTLNSDDKTRHQIFGRSNECQCNFSWELSALLIKDQLMCWLFDGFSSSPQSRSIPLVFWKRRETLMKRMSAVVVVKATNTLFS